MRVVAEQERQVEQQDFAAVTADRRIGRHRELDCAELESFDQVAFVSELRVRKYLDRHLAAGALGNEIGEFLRAEMIGIVDRSHMAELELDLVSGARIDGCGAVEHERKPHGDGKFGKRTSH